MKRRLFMVDYRKNGVDMHKAIEMGCTRDVTVLEIIEVCQEYIGKRTILDSIVEIYADMTANELNNISMSPLFELLPKRLLFINTEALKRFKEKMEKGKS